MRMIKSLFIFFIFTCGLQANAVETNVEFCNGCSNVEKQTRANSWAMRNLSPQDPPHLYHSVDLAERVTKTYEVKVAYVQMPPPQPPRPAPHSKLVPTPDEIKAKSGELYTHFRALNDDLNRVSIPENIIGNAWEIVGCAYCGTRVEQYLQSHTNSERIYRNLEAIAEALGLLSSSIPSTYKIALEAGGEITVELSVRGDTGIDIVIIEAVDVDGNVVPLTADGLRGLRVYVSSVDHAREINVWVGSFGYSVPVRFGRVTMQECGPNNDDQPSPCFK